MKGKLVERAVPCMSIKEKSNGIYRVVFAESIKIYDKLTDETRLDAPGEALDEVEVLDKVEMLYVKRSQLVVNRVEQRDFWLVKVMVDEEELRKYNHDSRDSNTIMAIINGCASENLNKNRVYYVQVPIGEIVHVPPEF